METIKAFISPGMVSGSIKDRKVQIQGPYKKHIPGRGRTIRRSITLQVSIIENKVQLTRLIMDTYLAINQNLITNYFTYSNYLIIFEM